MFEQVKSAYERLLEAIVIILMVGLSIVVLLGIAYRSAGAALVWYDEVAAITLAWLTYYGAALAALKRSHIGVPEIIRMVPPAWRVVMFAAAEILVIGFFALTAWIGYEVLVILEGSTLVSLPEVPEQLAQSVIPIGAVLFIIAQVLSMPDAWRKTMAGDTGHPDADRKGLGSEMASTE
ncbi:MAG TPA: TRAP transporter small permease [Alphaproteobacteria bacterium]